MYRSKLFVLLVFAGLVVWGCAGSGKKKFVIAESKSYEASLFRQNCAICHGPEAEGRTLEDGKEIPNLRQGPFKYGTDAQIYQHIADGGNGMVPFRGQLTERELQMMVQFVQRDLRGK
ncbi:MAG: cytochrome c [Pyrinomonadaceae bacterium]